MNRIRFAFFRLGITGFALGLLATGCASPHMKGAPFYTGGGTARPGSREEPINIWPLFYYHKPDLRILWPVFEKTDDWLAIRPLMSVYGLKDQRPVYNVLWPIARFDPHRKRYRVFPVFWGEKTATVFPLYWHRGEPFGAQGGSSTMIPLWHVERDAQGHNTHVLWPLLHFKNRESRTGWRAWPLLGSYRDTTAKKHYRFVAWPFGHDWHDAHANERFQTLFPIYIYTSLPSEKHVLSPIAAAGWTKSGDRWHGVLPLYFTARFGEERTFGTLLGGFRKDGPDASWFFTPLLSGGYHDEHRGGRIFILGPLAHARWSEDGRRHHLFPVYSAAKHADRSHWASLLYGHGTRKSDASGWRYLIPFFISTYDEDRSSLISLLGGWRREGDGGQWMAVPLLSGGHWGEKRGAVYALGPLAHARWSETARSSHVLPFFYRSENADGRRFVSPLWMSGATSAGDAWRTVPLLYWHSGNERRQRTLTPLAAWGSAAKSNERWHTVLPFYYRHVSDKGALTATLLGGTQRRADGRRWLLYPLASWGSRGSDSARAWVLAPFFHWNRDAQGSAHHLLPFYYWDGRDKTFVSPATVTWPHADGGRTTLVPPALSWLTASNRRKDLWALGPLAHFSWGEQAGPHHVFPIYYRNPNTGTFASLPATRWKNRDGSRTTLIPPALSWLTASDKRRDLWALGPLAHFSWGQERGSHHVFPLYYRNPESKTFVSLPVARWKNSDASRTTLIPPALSWLTTSNRRKDLWLLGPLAHFSWGEQAGTHHVFPLYYRNPNTGTFLSLLVSRRKENGAESWLIPPVLGGYWNHGNEKEVAALLGLFYNAWGHPTRAPSGHLLPLYMHRGKKVVYTPIAGWNKEGDRGFVYPLTPLFGIRTGLDAGSWLFPIYSYTRDKQRDAMNLKVLWGGYQRDGARRSSGLFPLYGYRNHVAPESETDSRRHALYGKSFWSLPACWYKNQTRARGDIETRIRQNGFFPLWSYARNETPSLGAEDVKGSFLLFLFRHQREIKPTVSKPELKRETALTSVLWYLWRREQEDDGVSVEAFPFIVYNRKGDEFKRITFLYRFFRYERDAEGIRLDLLFIPLKRP